MKIIESNTEGMAFEAAFIREENGALVPRCVFGGHICNIDTKPGPLADGIAWCQPVDGTPEEEWPLWVKIEKDGFEDTRFNMTDDPRVVAAARKFAELQESGAARAGMEL